jgi:hypothetical protein
MLSTDMRFDEIKLIIILPGLISCMIFITDSRLSQLPSTKTKGAANAKAKPEASANAPAVKGAAKKGDKKGDKKGGGHGTEQTAAPVDSSTYEVIEQCKGSALVGKKYVTFETFQFFQIPLSHYIHDNPSLGAVTTTVYFACL